MGAWLSAFIAALDIPDRRDLEDHGFRPRGHEPECYSLARRRLAQGPYRQSLKQPEQAVVRTSKVPKSNI